MLLMGCIEPYDFKVQQTERSVVIAGLLTDREDAHKVSISYSYPITGAQNTPIRGAEVWFEDEDNQVTPLPEASAGIYQTDPTFKAESLKIYTLFIENADGQNFQSTPQLMPYPGKIDSLYGKYEVLPSSDDHTDSRGVQLYIDSFQDIDGIFNYRFEYKESYKMTVPLPSQLDWEGRGPSFRVFERPESVETCYRIGKPGPITLSTTRGLSAPNLTEYPIQFISEDDPHLVTEYRIQVTQYSISEESYAYYQTLKEINEAGGSFFDKQKGTVFGNMFNSDEPATFALGYFEVAGVSSLRQSFTAAQFVSQGLHLSDTICNSREIAASFGFSVFQDTIEVRPTIFGDTVYTIVSRYTWGPLDDYLHNNQMEGPSMNIVDTVDNVANLTYKYCSDCQLYGRLEKPEIWN